MSEPHFLYEKRGHTAICTFNRPEKRNSLSMEMLVRMADAWAEADNDPEVRAIVLTGAGGTFCAGSDLGSMSTGKWDAEDVWMNRMKEDPDIHWRALLRHYTTKKPLIAADEGYSDVAAVRSNDSLRLVRDDPRWPDLLARLRENEAEENR